MNKLIKIILVLHLLLVAPEISLAGSQTFNSSSTFTVPAGVTSVTVEVWGGGAGGSNGWAIAGQSYGGGGGGYGRGSLSVVPGSTYTILVGSGGLGGDGNGYSLATNGNITEFKTTSGSVLVSATGGSAYRPGTGSGLPYGGTSGAIYNISGGSGLIGTPLNSYCYSFTGGNCAGGGANGGNGGNGGAGGVGASNTGVSTNGVSPGGGGGGGGGTRASGASGQITVSWVNPPVVGTISVSSNISSSWTTTGPATITGSGTSQTSASKPVGTYTITWGAVTGYATPASQSLTLTSGGTVTFSGNYSLNSYTVSTSAGAGGTISPVSSSVSYGSTTTFTISPNAGYITASVTGCGGSLSGNSYTTGAITAACTVSATYTLINVFPTSPTISGPTTLTTGHSGTYSFVSTDPQGDQVRYGVDWNMDGTADNWLPVFPNYEPSGTSLSMSYTWPTTGSKQFQALAQDTMGNNSAWTTYTITVSDPQPCTAGVVDSSGTWAPTCSTSATCLTPPDPAQLTNQTGIQIGICPTPEYTGNAYRSCSTATITCTQATFCGDNTCNGSETLLTCPTDCKGRYQQF